MMAGPARAPNQATEKSMLLVTLGSRERLVDCRKPISNFAITTEAFLFLDTYLTVIQCDGIKALSINGASGANKRGSRSWSVGLLEAKVFACIASRGRPQPVTGTRQTVA
jgi:hypothetical protein